MKRVTLPALLGVESRPAAASSRIQESCGSTAFASMLSCSIASL